MGLNHNAGAALRGWTAVLDGVHNDTSVVCQASVSRVLARSTGWFSASLRPRWREVTALRARAARSGTDALRVATHEQETDMDLPTLVAHWSGKLPEGFVPPAIVRRTPPAVFAKAMPQAGGDQERRDLRPRVP